MQDFINYTVVFMALLSMFTIIVALLCFSSRLLVRVMERVYGLCLLRRAVQEHRQRHPEEWEKMRKIFRPQEDDD